MNHFPCAQDLHTHTQTVMYLSTGECVLLIEVHLSSECFQEEFTHGLVDHDIGRVPDGSVELIPEFCILCRDEPGNRGTDTCYMLRFPGSSRPH